MWPFTRKYQVKPKEEPAPVWAWVAGDWAEVLYCHCGARTSSWPSDASNKSPECRPCSVCGCMGRFARKVSRIDSEVNLAVPHRPVRATRVVFWEGCTEEAQRKDLTDKE